jgi:hypothetical protein
MARFVSGCSLSFFSFIYRYSNAIIAGTKLPWLGRWDDGTMTRLGRWDDGTMTRLGRWQRGMGLLSLTMTKDGARDTYVSPSRGPGMSSVFLSLFSVTSFIYRCSNKIIAGTKLLQTSATGTMTAEDGARSAYASRASGIFFFLFYQLY